MPKKQVLPYGASLIKTIDGKDVYAFNNWFYWLDASTGEVLQVEHQKYSTFLMKYLPKKE